MDGHGVIQEGIFIVTEKSSHAAVFAPSLSCVDIENDKREERVRDFFVIKSKLWT